jgi:hypothetical protein
MEWEEEERRERGTDTKQTKNSRTHLRQTIKHTNTHTPFLTLALLSRFVGVVFPLKRKKNVPGCDKISSSAQHTEKGVERSY